MSTEPAPFDIVLASASPRRHALLAAAGIRAVAVPADVDETPLPHESPTDLVRRLSLAKASRIVSAGTTVLAADTIVVVDDEVLGKPVDESDAGRMLRSLSGRTHAVLTGVTVIDPSGSPRTHVERTDVTFVTLSAADIDWYVSTGESLDKAGGYGIQGSAARFVERVQGSYSNIVGLPLAAVVDLLRAAGTSIPRPGTID